MGVVRVVACVVVLWAAGACTSPGSGSGSTAGSSAGSNGAGCGTCTEELAEVRAEIEALSDVKQVLTLEKYDSSPTNGAGVRIELRSRSTGEDAVVDEVARIVWQSRLAPVDEVFVTVEDAAGELVRGGSPFDFTEAGGSRTTYEERWGPRPVE